MATNVLEKQKMDKKRIEWAKHFYMLLKEYAENTDVSCVIIHDTDLDGFMSACNIAAMHRMSGFTNTKILFIPISDIFGADRNSNSSYNYNDIAVAALDLFASDTTMNAPVYILDKTLRLSYTKHPNTIRNSRSIFYIDHHQWTHNNLFANKTNCDKTINVAQSDSGVKRVIDMTSAYLTDTTWDSSTAHLTGMLLGEYMVDTKAKGAYRAGIAGEIVSAADIFSVPNHTCGAIFNESEPVYRNEYVKMVTSLFHLVRRGTADELICAGNDLERFIDRRAKPKSVVNLKMDNMVVFRNGIARPLLNTAFAMNPKTFKNEFDFDRVSLIYNVCATMLNLLTSPDIRLRDPDDCKIMRLFKKVVRYYDRGLVADAKEHLTYKVYRTHKHTETTPIIIQASIKGDSKVGKTACLNAIYESVPEAKEAIIILIPYHHHESTLIVLPTMDKNSPRHSDTIIAQGRLRELRHAFGSTKMYNIDRSKIRSFVRNHYYGIGREYFDEKGLPF